MSAAEQLARQLDRTSAQVLDGDAFVMCTFDYAPAELGRTASVTVTGVAINGHEVDSSVFAQKVIDKWEADILREVLEDEADARALAEELWRDS